jgi:hypothetical protein
MEWRTLRFWAAVLAVLALLYVCAPALFWIAVAIVVAGFAWLAWAAMSGFKFWNA